jgi:hypothetical protein
MVEKKQEKKQPQKASCLECLMSSQLFGASIEEWEVEYAFFPPRKWRFDFAWPSRKVALEVEGGTFSDGAHTRGKGFEEDCEKYNAAILLGWKVIRATGNQVKSGAALIWVENLLRAADLALKEENERKDKENAR